MKRCTKKFQKTDHFLYRQWDRKVDDDVINAVLKNISRTVNNKTMLIVSNKLLRKLGYRCPSNENLIIVIKRNVLITLFKVNDLYEYMKNHGRTTKVIIN